MISSAADQGDLDRIRRQTLLALFTAMAIVVHTFEILLPAPVPWMRLGLANILTVVVLVRYGGRAAWSLTLTRIVVGSLLLGRLFGPGFWLALAGGCVATLVMVQARRLARERLSPVGLSVLGAAGHATGQLLIAWLLLIRNPAIWQIFPFFLLSALAAGVLTGWIAAILLDRLAERLGPAGGLPKGPRHGTIGPKRS